MPAAIPPKATVEAPRMPNAGTASSRVAGIGYRCQGSHQAASATARSAAPTAARMPARSGWVAMATRARLPASAKSTAPCRAATRGPSPMTLRRSPSTLCHGPYAVGPGPGSQSAVGIRSATCRLCSAKNRQTVSSQSNPDRAVGQT